MQTTNQTPSLNCPNDFSLPQFFQLIEETIKQYLEIFPTEKETLNPLVQALQGEQPLWDRQHTDCEGHLSATLLVVDRKTKKVLLIYHNALKRWIPVGGHFETSHLYWHKTAEQEALEELGQKVDLITWWTDSIMPIPVFINRHFIPSTPGKELQPHCHWDALFLAELKGGGIGEIDYDQREIQEIRWVPWYELVQYPYVQQCIPNVVYALRETHIVS